jgi:hypothetical protein
VLGVVMISSTVLGLLELCRIAGAHLSRRGRG